MEVAVEPAGAAEAAQAAEQLVHREVAQEEEQVGALEEEEDHSHLRHPQEVVVDHSHLRRQQQEDDNNQQPRLYSNPRHLQFRPVTHGNCNYLPECNYHEE